MFAAAVAVLVVGCLGVGSARAETLKAALADAYTYNPLLDASRARLRALDETVSQANGNFRPSVTSGGTLLRQRDNISEGGTTANLDTRAADVAISIDQSLFRGLRNINELRQSEASVRAGRAELAAAEQALLLAVVAAYVDVYTN
ncbi:MAG: TolC family protein, partial [Pseudomonadota bacterium]